MGFLVLQTSSGYTSILVDPATESAPDAPSNLSAAAMSASRIDLNWTDNSSNETGFTIERSLTGTSGWVELSTTQPNVTSFSDTGLAASTAYYYRILATGDGGNSAYSSTVSATTEASAALAAPTNLRLTTNEGRAFTVDWDDNTGGTALTQVSVSTDNGAYWFDDFYGNAAAGVTTKHINYLVENSLTKVRLRAIDGQGGIGAWSTVLDAYTSPNPPGNVQVVGASPTRAVISWIDSSIYETGYEVRWSLANQNSWSSATLDPNVSVKVITGLTANTSYDVQVRVLGTYANSSWSVVLNVTTPVETLPAAPTGVALVPITYSRLDAHWTRNSTNEDYFEVQRCGDSAGAPDGNWVAAGSTWPGAEAHEITGLTVTSTYWARVRAVNGAGASAWVISTASGTTPATNNSPTGWEPRLQWSAAQQAIWNQMKADYTATPNGTTLAIKVYATLKNFADNTGTPSGASSDYGSTATFMYQITGNPDYAEVGIDNLKLAANSIQEYSDNAREYFIEMVTMFDWLYPAMSYIDRKFLISRFKILAQAELDNFRPADSDQTIGSAYGGAAMMAYSACVLDDPTCADYLSNVKIGGLTATGANYDNDRNAIKAYLETPARGGEWMESTEYNTGTVKLLLMLWYGLKTATGTDHLPEVQAELENMAKVFLVQLVPSLGQAVQWGDNQIVRTAYWGERSACLGMLAGALKGTTTGEWALKGYHDALIAHGYGALGRNAFTRSLYMLDPYQAESDWRSGSDLLSLFSAGMGTLYLHDGWSTNDSLFYVRFEERALYYDHSHKNFGNIQLWRKNEWAITHPIGDGYGAWDWYATNCMGIGGLSWFADRTMFGAQIASDRSWAYSGGTTGGKYYSGVTSEPVFCNEHTRYVVCLPSSDKTVDTFVMFDRVDAVDPLSLSTEGQINALYDSGDAALILGTYYGDMGVKQWTIHSPVEPTVTTNKLAWDTAGGQHVRVQTLLPASITATTIDESAVPIFSPLAFDSSEKKWQTRIKPSTDQQWDTFLNVVQVYDGSAPTVPTLIQSSAGQTAQGCLIQRTGDSDHLLMFGARANAGNRLITTGYTVSWTQATATAKVLLLNLDPAKAWTYTIDGGGSTSLTVSSLGIAVFTVNTATSHTLVLTGA